jgi:outer membrane protein assembly factor BamB
MPFVVLPEMGDRSQWRGLKVITVGLLVWGFCATVPGQDVTAPLIDAQQLAQAGLERQWFTRAATSNKTPGDIRWALFVSQSEGKTVFDVQFPGGRLRFSDRDIDSRGTRLGVEGAKRKADLAVERLMRRGQQAQLSEHQVPDVHLVVMTPAASLQCFDAESGELLWETQIGLPGHPVYPPAVSEKHVAVVHGTQVVVLDHKTGRVIWSKRTEGVPGAGPAMNPHYLFAPMHNGAIEVYNLDDPAAPMKVMRSLGHPTWQPLTSQFTVSWPTDSGHFYVAGLQQNQYQIYYRIEAGKSIEAAPAYNVGEDRRGRFYIPSLDGYLYCADERTGAVIWSFSTGESLYQTPVLFEGFLYFVTGEHNLFKVSESVAEVAWIVPGISQILAVAGNRLYCATRLGELIVVDANSGTRLYATSAKLPPIRMSNVLTDRIYLSNKFGVIECVRPIGAVYPTVYVQKAEVAPAAPAAGPKAKEEAPPVPAPAGAETDDPFKRPPPPAPAAPGGDDPFRRP